MSRGYKVIFLDEVMFTFSTNQARDYSNKNVNITVMDKALLCHTIAVVASASANEGIESYELFDRSVNQQRFIAYLKALKVRNKRRKFCVFLDNLRVHHGKLVKEAISELKIPFIFNLPYRPEYNPIENVFSLVKNSFKRKKLNNIMREERFSNEDLVNWSFDCQDHRTVGDICRKGIKRIMKAKF
jgi:transposase